jgi:hypothetical protein
LADAVPAQETTAATIISKGTAKPGTAKPGTAKQRRSRRIFLILQPEIRLYRARSTARPLVPGNFVSGFTAPAQRSSLLKQFPRSSVPL